MMMRYFKLTSLILFFAATPALASEATGTLSVNTGVETGISGVVVTAPTASSSAGTYNSTQSVVLTASGASSIYYTTDGTTTPICSTTGSAYSSAISVTSSRTVQARSCYPNGVSSTVASFAYVLQCATQSVSNGSVGAYPSCTITCNSGYTLSGSTCTASGGGSSVAGGGGGGGSSYTPIITTTTTATTTATTVTTTTASTGAGAGSGTGTGTGTGGTGTLPTTVSGLRALINTLLAQLQSLITQAQNRGIALPKGIEQFSAKPTPAVKFTLYLKLGDINEEVRLLQQVLNGNGFLVARSGPGSPGNETNKFGAATRATVMRLQRSAGISPTGTVGPLTRKYLNSL